MPLIRTFASATLLLGLGGQAHAYGFHCGPASVDLELIQSVEKGSGYFQNTYRIRYALEKGRDVALNQPTHHAEIYFDRIHADNSRSSGRILSELRWGSFTNEITEMQKGSQVSRAYFSRLVCSPGDSFSR